MAKKYIPVKSLTARDLPAPVRVFWETAPENFKIPSMLTALCCYCALGTRIRVKYKYDSDLHALLLQIVVVGNPGDGKSFTRPIVYKLINPIKLRDDEMRRQEQAYKDLVKQNQGKSKATLPEEPLTDIRFVQKITYKKLIKRADLFNRKYGDTLAFMFYSEELAGIQEQYRNAYSDLRTASRLAYDLGALDSNDTLSDSSYNAMVDIIWCSLFCATPAALDKYMDKTSIEGGNVTRNIIAELGDLMGEEAPVFRPMTAGENACVDSTVKRLMDETYSEEGQLQPTRLVDMDWLFDDVESWCQEQRTKVLKTGSRSLNCFYKRSSVSAFRLATMCYYLFGEGVGCEGEGVSPVRVKVDGEGKSLNTNPSTLNSKPSTDSARQHVRRFYYFMAQYILDGLMKRWGKKYEQLQPEPEDSESSQAPIYDQLPKQFSRDQLRELINKLQLGTKARQFIFKWKKNKLIYQPNPEEDVFVKNY